MKIEFEIPDELEGVVKDLEIETGVSIVNMLEKLIPFVLFGSVTNPDGIIETFKSLGTTEYGKVLQDYVDRAGEKEKDPGPF